ncbi:glycosyltransferase family 2 protein [Burkholderia sp. F1]|uniref:glycosyltransferase family 2 protein n=1 Tax=Burkholderia sp. F1 TaxID=3366817 RepID=UPI003D7285DB
MPTVSILIPAYKPEYLHKALSTARAQTFTDIEILVGDDTADGKLREIVESFDDPRIRYFHHGFQDGLKNSRGLWEKSTGKYVKWLYDDDMLGASSVEVLVNALRLQPDAVMAFHERVFIDADDKVIHVPAALVTAGHIARIDRNFLVQNMVGHASNFIGEPSNIMMVREGVDIAAVMMYRSRTVKFLTDVAMYLNLAEQAPLVLVGGFHSGFRSHPNQNSSGTSPIIAAGYYEWELMVRGEATAGLLSGEALNGASERLKQLYAHGVQTRNISELDVFIQHLDELTEQPVAELFDSPRFHADIALVHKMMAARAGATQAPSSIPPAA